MASSGDESFKLAVASFQAGRLNDAERQLKKVLRHQPKHVATLELLSFLLAHLERYAEAESYIKSAVELNARSGATLYNYGLILKFLKRPAEALEWFSQALTINATAAEIWNNRGAIFNELNRHDDAIVDLNKAIELQPDYPEAFANKGISLFELKRFDEAFAAFDKALALKPDLAVAWLGRSNLFYLHKRHDEAFAAYDKLLSIKPDSVEACLGLGNVFYDLKRYDEAFAAYDRALSIKPDLEGAWFGLGNVFYDLKRYDEAVAAYDKALSIRSDLAEAWLGRGNVFYDLKRYDEASVAYDKALSIKPDLAEAWHGRGNVFADLKHYDEAFAAYDKALAIKHNLKGLEGSRLHIKMHLCNWNNFDAECKHLISAVRSGSVSTQPFPLLAIPSSSKDQFQCSKLWVAEKFSQNSAPLWQGERYNHDRIRVAYQSADFHQHATSSLMAELFECHEKSRFEVTAVSVGNDDNSEMRQRLKGSFEHFISAEAQSDNQIANLVRGLEIDILIDLKGFTQNARTNVFARRPAPIQVNYLGYPGTMGAQFIDYIIADRFVIPEEQREFYLEKIVTLPNSYQVNDDKRSIVDKAFTRAELGLPPTGFVFCCFNNNYKITPHIFECWMRILKQVENGVLWLLEDNPTAASNLRNEAVARGINAERLIFAKRMMLSDHLARHRLADLFLDTLPYNAHATASDALWAGLPVLTQIGETFAGRVAASLLNAIGLPELITTSSEAYVNIAIDLATNPERLAAIKRKLSDNHLTTPLFDTKLFTKHIEAAYIAMYERHQTGLPPGHIVVAN